MFIIRAAFWLLVVAVLIPTGNAATKRNVTQVSGQELSADDALNAAYATAGDVSSFCNRNPDVCATGSVAIDVIGYRARNGLRTIYDWATAAAGHVGTVDEQARPDHILTGSTQEVANNGAASQSTLRIDDIIPEWAGPDTDERA